jgi:hypothetical protein
MIKLYDRDDKELGTISADQLQFLIDSMEEESSEDQDYYINPITLDYLESLGADAGLMALLRTALGDRQGITVRWDK